MGDILKEAIADAKAVRETALENAKMALEEAFTPQIKSMLSAKLKEDDMDDDEVEEFGHDDEEGESEEGYSEDDEMGDEDEVEVPAEDAHVDDEAEEDAHEGEHDDEAEEGHGDDEEVEESNLDLEAIIRELEAELTEDEGDDEDEEVEESTETSDESVEESDEPVSEETVEEEYEIDEAELKEGEDDEDEDEKEVEESNTSAIEAELKEYKEAVHFLKDKLHEVNILNAKLLFTNKLFKSYSLDNNQKLKVVETFDRAQTTREIKLVYSTLAEQFQDNGSIITRKSIKESASAPVASTKPSKESRKVISEEVEVANRFKKLAGLIK